MKLRFELVEFGSNAHKETINLRDDILRKPLGLKFTKEQLDAEFNQLHLAGYNEKDELVCCLVLMDYNSEKMKMRQVAVAQNVQTKGIGTQLVKASENVALEKGKSIMFCHAREVAVPFYVKNGYNTYGEKFDEVGIPHFKMEKKLV